MQNITKKNCHVAIFVYQEWGLGCHRSPLLVKACAFVSLCLTLWHGNNVCMRYST